MVQRTVDALAKGWAKAPNVTVVDSMQDERVPEAVRKADAAQRSQGAMGEPEGFWYRGQVYLVASALPTSADAARVLYHEVLGHHGLRGHFGKDLDRVLDQVIKLRRKDVQAKAQEYGLDMDTTLNMLAMRPRRCWPSWRSHGLTWGLCSGPLRPFATSCAPTYPASKCWS